MRKTRVIFEVLSVKSLWIPLAIATPFLVFWPALGFKLVLFALLIPLTLASHEFLHVTFLPAGKFAFKKGLFFEIRVLDGVPIGVRFISAILPGIILGTMGLFILFVFHDFLIAFPFLIHFIILPVDLAGFGGMRLGE